MRIIHVMECFAGGTFEFLSTLTQEMKENEYIIIHGNRENTPLNYRERFPHGTMFLPWEHAHREISFMADCRAFMELMRYFKKYMGKESVIHLHSSKAGFLGRLAAWLLGKSDRVIYTAHGAAFLRLDVSKMKHYFYVVLERIGSCFGGMVVACSSSEGEEFKRYGIKDVAVINNGIKMETEKEVVKLGNQIVIGTLARITYQKNPRLFNEIASQLIHDQRIKFLWVGDGELRNELKSPNIEITGWLDKKAAREKLREIDIYLSTSLWEGLPLSALEAMALRKPLVLSNCVGNRDLISGNGFLINNGKININCFYEIITDIKSENRMGERSFEHLKKLFSLKKCINQYKNIVGIIKDKNDNI